MPVGRLPTPIGLPTSDGEARSIRLTVPSLAVGDPDELLAERDALRVVADRDLRDQDRLVARLEPLDRVAGGVGHPDHALAGDDAVGRRCRRPTGAGHLVGRPRRCTDSVPASRSATNTRAVAERDAVRALADLDRGDGPGIAGGRRRGRGRRGGRGAGRWRSPSASPPARRADRPAAEHAGGGQPGGGEAGHEHRRQRGAERELPAPRASRRLAAAAPARRPRARPARRGRARRRSGSGSAGSLAIARATTASSAGGSFGPASATDGGGSLRWAYIFATSLSRANGQRARERLVEHAAERVDVGARVGRLAAGSAPAPM